MKPAKSESEIENNAARDNIFAFSEIIKKIGENDKKISMPILKRIEFNTSFLKKFNGLVPTIERESRPVIAPSGMLPRTAPLRRRDEKGRFLARMEEIAERKKQVPSATAKPATEEHVRGEREKAAFSEPVVPEPAIDHLPIDHLPEAVTKTAPAREQKESSASKEPTALSPGSSSKRDNRGRFVGESKSQEARSEQRDKGEKKSILKSLKDSFEGVSIKGKSTLAANVGTVEEAAGRAAGGPVFEAAMELKGAIGSALDEDSMVGKAARWAGEKTSLFKEEAQAPKEARDEKGRFLAGTAKADDESKKIIETLKSSENEDDKRHKELIKAILKEDKEKGTESMGLPSSKKTGPGARAKEKLKKSVKKSQIPTATKALKSPGMPGGGMLGKLGSMAMKIGPMLAALPLGPIAAVLTAAGAGVAIGTGINKAINWAGEIVTGKEGWTSGEAIYDATHPKAAPSKSTVEGYKEQRGNIAAAAKATDVSQDTLTKMAGVESGFNSQAGASTSSAKGTFQFTQGTWRAMLKKHGAKYGLSENTSVFDSKANALMGAEYTKENKQALEAAGVKADDTSLYMSHFLGTGGGVKFMKGLQGGKGDKAAAEDFQDASVANRSIFYDKSGRARSYKEIHSLLSNRMDQYGQDRMDALATGKSETAIASGEKRLQELRAERETNWDKMPADQRDDWSKKVMAVRRDMAKEQQPIPTATSALPTKGKVTAATTKEPVTSLATGTPTRAVSPPERITTAMEKTAATPSPVPAGTKPGFDTNNMFAALDKLNATMTKMTTGKDDETKSGMMMPIRTEFDDTMLTLMAYDRV